MIETVKAYALLLKIAAAVLLVIAGVWCWWNSHGGPHHISASRNIAYEHLQSEGYFNEVMQMKPQAKPAMRPLVYRLTRHFQSDVMNA